MVANCLTRNNYEKKVKEYSEFFKSLRGIAILIKMSVDLGRLQRKKWIKEGGGCVKIVLSIMIFALTVFWSKPVYIYLCVT